MHNYNPNQIALPTRCVHDLATEISQGPSEWLRDVLAAAVLSIVSEEETYGYLIGQRLAEGGLGVVKGGTLYPLLTRLEQDRDPTATWRKGNGGPGRKYYTITPAGQERLNSLRVDWEIFSLNATSIIRGKNAGNG